MPASPPTKPTAPPATSPAATKPPNSPAPTSSPPGPAAPPATSASTGDPPCRPPAPPAAATPTPPAPSSSTVRSSKASPAAPPPTRQEVLHGRPRKHPPQSPRRRRRHLDHRQLRPQTRHRLLNHLPGQTLAPRQPRRHSPATPPPANSADTSRTSPAKPSTSTTSLNASSSTDAPPNSSPPSAKPASSGSSTAPPGSSSSKRKPSSQTFSPASIPNRRTHLPPRHPRTENRPVAAGLPQHPGRPPLTADELPSRHPPAHHPLEPEPHGHGRPPLLRHARHHGQNGQTPRLRRRHHAAALVRRTALPLPHRRPLHRRRSRPPLRAYNLRTGAELWKTRLGTSLQGHPVSFSIDGFQNIAVTTGLGGGRPRDLPRIVAPEIHHPANGNALYVFRLPSR